MRLCNNNVVLPGFMMKLISHRFVSVPRRDTAAFAGRDVRVSLQGWGPRLPTVPLRRTRNGTTDCLNNIIYVTCLLFIFYLTDSTVRAIAIALTTNSLFIQTT